MPIIVTMPPKIVAKDKGMSVCFCNHLDFLEIFKSTGIKIAKVATLFIKEDIKLPKIPKLSI